MINIDNNTDGKIVGKVTDDLIRLFESSYKAAVSQDNISKALDIIQSSVTSKEVVFNECVFNNKVDPAECELAEMPDREEPEEDTDADLETLETLEIPDKFSYWTHRNGNIYKVLQIANLSSEDIDKYPITVVYQGNNSKVWARPLSSWHRSFTPTK